MWLTNSKLQIDFFFNVRDTQSIVVIAAKQNASRTGTVTTHPHSDARADMQATVM